MHGATASTTHGKNIIHEKSQVIKTVLYKMTFKVLIGLGQTYFDSYGLNPISIISNGLGNFINKDNIIINNMTQCYATLSRTYTLIKERLI